MQIMAQMGSQMNPHPPNRSDDGSSLKIEQTLGASLGGGASGMQRSQHHNNKAQKVQQRQGGGLPAASP